jgi:hypothetical protein
VEVAERGGQSPVDHHRDEEQREIEQGIAVDPPGRLHEVLGRAYAVHTAQQQRGEQQRAHHVGEPERAERDRQNGERHEQHGVPPHLIHRLALAPDEGGAIRTFALP